MIPAEAFRQLISRLTPIMKEHGFKKHRNTYKLYRGNNIGLIDIQKSRRTSAQCVIFTINIGIFSGRLARFSFFEEKDVHSVNITECHYRLRIGHLLEPGDDKWWTITNETDVDEIYSEVRAAICDYAIPEMLSSISDEALRDRALSESLPGATDMMMFEYLLVFLRDLGPAERLPEILRKLRGIARDPYQIAIIESLIKDLQLDS